MAEDYVARDPSAFDGERNAAGILEAAMRAVKHPADARSGESNRARREKAIGHEDMAANLCALSTQCIAARRTQERGATREITVNPGPIEPRCPAASRSAAQLQIGLKMRITSVNSCEIAAAQKERFR
jgi:hypothetical protein